MESSIATKNIHIGHQDFKMHTRISNNKRGQRQKQALLKRNRRSVQHLQNAKTIEKRQPVSTLTHSTREVAEHFLEWREQQKDLSMIGHNNPPEDDNA